MFKTDAKTLAGQILFFEHYNQGLDASAKYSNASLADEVLRLPEDSIDLGSPKKEKKRATNRKTTATTTTMTTTNTTTATKKRKSKVIVDREEPLRHEDDEDDEDEESSREARKVRCVTGSRHHRLRLARDQSFAGFLKQSTRNRNFVLPLKAFQEARSQLDDAKHRLAG
ncbi:hypothetical protein HKX48_008221 [Thoreauomyces humboldtii]|nr:hypothetical protein HKX48_008221 [Thoreauomyces humboldtii]